VRRQTALGFNLLCQNKGTDAEPILRDCLAIREKEAPDLWTTVDTKSQLSSAILAQKYVRMLGNLKPVRQGCPARTSERTLRVFATTAPVVPQREDEGTQ
jgi:hypothetical protein